MDEMWSRVRSKNQSCWLWYAINHDNGDVVAYVLGSRKIQSLEKLTTLISKTSDFQISFKKLS